MPNTLQIYAPDPDLPPASQPLKTGQTVQYDGKEDDGYWEKGISRLYHVLSVGQYSGTTNITVNGKTISMENRCAYDVRTGKMWMARTPDSDIGPGNDGKLYYLDAVNSEHIFEFCDQANGANFAGHNDWRVPNINELVGIIDFHGDGAGVIINLTAFPSTPADEYWSNTTRSDATTYAFVVHFRYYRFGYARVKSTGAYYVRLVRDI